MKKSIEIIIQSSPVIVIVLLIPVIPNDYYLAIAYTFIIICSLLLQRQRNDILIFFFGLTVMTVSETFFLMTEVETFNRISLFGIMPIWLPLLWAYGFVTIKRSIKILER